MKVAFDFNIRAAYGKIGIWSRIWNSPTLNTWANQVASLSRLFILTPLVLTRFDEIEVAVWLLFSSINFFGQVVAVRVNQTFTRMFAFAMGGATDLSPILQPRDSRGDGKPNWPLIDRLYGTLSLIQIGMAALVAAIAAVLAIYSVSNLIGSYHNSGKIWTGVAIMVGSSAVIFLQQKYNALLQGLSYVAVANRISAGFNMFAIVASVLALWCGGGFLWLVGISQISIIFGGVCSYMLVRAIEGGRFQVSRNYSWDRQIATWAWSPIWKGFIYQIAGQGVPQIIGVLLTQMGSAGLVAMYLLAIRVSSMISQLSMVPYLSHAPLLSRLLAEGRIVELRHFCIAKIRLVMILAIAAYISAGYFLGPLLSWMDSSIQFLAPNAWFILGIYALLERFNILSLSTSTIGNHYVYHWHQLAAGIMSIMLSMPAFRIFGISGLIFAQIIPGIIIVNCRLAAVAGRVLNMSTFQFLQRTLVPAMIVYVVLGVLTYFSIQYKAGS